MGAVIVGAGGHAQDIASWHPLSTVDHHSALGCDDRRAVLIGINDPATRARVAAQLGRSAAMPAIHPTAHVGYDCDLWGGVVVGALSSLLYRVELHSHVHVGAGCHLTRCAVGAFTTIAPGVTVCGDVTIGERCFIGAGATVKNLVTIGNDVTIGAGAVVVHDVPDGVTIKGVPAR